MSYRRLMRHRLLRVLLFLVLGAVASYWISTRLHKVEIWLGIGLVWTAFFTYLAICARNELARIAWITLALFILCLSGYETWLWLKNPMLLKVRYEGNFDDIGYFIDHPILGKAPRPGVQAHFRKSVDGTLLYNVVYRIDGNGLRSAPPHDEAGSCVLFFGGSYTFGEGVENEQTLPYRVGELGDGSIQTYNFGFHGYGPHHMLAAVEEGLVDDIVACRPTHIIYQAIPDHVRRTSGRLLSGFHAPRYLLPENGALYKKGFFDDESLLPPGIRGFLNRSLVFRRLTADKSPLNRYDLDRYAAIVARARDIFSAGNDGTSFTVLLWEDGNSKLVREIANRFLGHEIRFYPVEESVGISDRGKYRLSAEDPHPNALAYDRIARFLLDEVIN